jgi:endonuclease-3 related protein
MREAHGPQHWWPADTAFEVCIGAILTQNTAWTNVERAIINLKTAGVLEPHRMLAMPESQLAELIRPAGYFNVKTRRVRAFLRVLVTEYQGDLDRLFAGETNRVRARLLAVNGIGPETADSLLLYAGRHLSFVIDAYTKRIFLRHGWCRKDDGYDALKQLCETALDLGQMPPTQLIDYWQDYHAQLVKVGKEHCRARVACCAACPLRCLLPKANSTRTARASSPGPVTESVSVLKSASTST